MTPIEILYRLRAIEREAKTLSIDCWRDHPLACEYRSLLREWWTLPSSACMHVLYSADLPFRNRLMTSTATIPDKRFVEYRPYFNGDTTAVQGVPYTVRENRKEKRAYQQRIGLENQRLAIVTKRLLETESHS